MDDNKDIIVTGEEWKKLIENAGSLLPTNPEEPWQYIYIMRKVPQSVAEGIQKRHNKELAESKVADMRKLAKDINDLGYQIGFYDTLGPLSEKRTFRTIALEELSIE